MWSLVTLAMMLAAAMETLFASPFTMGIWGISTPGMVTASLSSSPGSSYWEAMPSLIALYVS